MDSKWIQVDLNQGVAYDHNSKSTSNHGYFCLYSSELGFESGRSRDSIENNNQQSEILGSLEVEQLTKNTTHNK